MRSLALFIEWFIYLLIDTGVLGVFTRFSCFFFVGICTFQGPASNRLGFCQEFNVSAKLILVSIGKHGPVSLRSCHGRLPCGYMQRALVGS